MFPPRPAIHFRLGSSSGTEQDTPSSSSSNERLTPSHVRLRGFAGFLTRGPRRFLMPGELAGAPAFTFAPLALGSEALAAPKGSLHAMME